MSPPFDRKPLSLEGSSSTLRGFTIVELLLVLTTTLSLGAVAVTFVLAQVRESRAIEAVSTIERIRQAVTQSGAADHGGISSGKLAKHLQLSANVKRLCRSAMPVPVSIGSVRGRSYDASSREWSSGDEGSGWRCLRMEQSGPQRYQYGYDVAPGGGVATERFTIWARGDLDGDGRNSHFRTTGSLIKSRIVHDETISVVDRAE